MTVDWLAKRYSIRMRKPFLQPLCWGEGKVSGERLVVAEPLTFMNRSGEVVPRLLRRCGLESRSLLVVCDTLDLPVGSCRLKPGGGSAGHHGVESIASALGTTEFPRLFIGIGRPALGEIVEYVLGAFSEQQAPLIEAAVERAAQAAIALLTAPIAQVMNGLNQRNPSAHPQG